MGNVLHQLVGVQVAGNSSESSRTLSESYYALASSASERRQQTALSCKLKPRRGRGGKKPLLSLLFYFVVDIGASIVKRRNMRLLVLLVMIMFQVVLWVGPLAVSWRVCDETLGLLPRDHAAEVKDLRGPALTANACATVVLAVVIFYVIRHGAYGKHCKNASRARQIMMAAWWCLAVYTAGLTVSWCWPGQQGDLIAVCIYPVSLATEVYQRFTFMWAVQTRVQLTEQAFGAQLGSDRIGSARWCVGIFGIVTTTIGAASFFVFYFCGPVAFSPWLSFCDVVYYFYELTAAIGQGVTALVAASALSKIVAKASLAVERGQGYVKAEAMWASGVLGRLRYAIVGPCSLDAITCTMLFCASLNSYVAPRSSLAQRNSWMLTLQEYATLLTLTLPIMVDVACLFFIVGLFQKEQPHVEIPVQVPKKKVLRRLRRAYTAQFRSKVQQLANRGIFVKELLEFYDKLGRDVMSHYRPAVSTTNDVVRQAIIPLSRTDIGGEAYVCVIHDGFEVLPDRMVTHAWDNLFLHLLAAVVADALNMDHYKGIADELISVGAAGIIPRLRALGTLHKAYWICAFCVNQHSSICGELGNMPQDDTEAQLEWKKKCHDTATGKVLPCCTCTQPKFLNDTPDECELNKFDEMMYYLRTEADGFRQLVAADINFVILSRAWCVAELVEAFNSKIPQDLCVFSGDAFGVEQTNLEVYRRIVNTSVVHCRASRAEDKAYILAKIDDVGHFDARLQAVIFGKYGLFNEKFEGFGTLEAAVRVARRASEALHQSV